MVRAIHRQPVGEMTESLEHDRAVVAKIMVLGAAVNQDALARCKYLLILAGQCRDMVCIGFGLGFRRGRSRLWQLQIRVSQEIHPKSC